MEPVSDRVQFLLRHPWGFAQQVIASFRRNQGFLLAGAVAYYTLLSIVPVSIVLLVLLSNFVDQAQLLETAGAYLEIAVPGQSGVVVAQIELFLEHRQLVGGAGLLIMLFFSSMAFTALENAMSVIFFHRVAIRRRHFLVSAVIPYLYLLFVGLGLLLVSVVSGMLQGFEDRALHLFGFDWPAARVLHPLFYLLGLAGQILLLTSLYMVMPVGKLAWRHALLGGVVAGVSWELTRHVLVWYFTSLSLVNVVYGSLATAIIILITFEVAALIVLLGAQCIAEFERIGLPDPPPDWHT